MQIGEWNIYCDTCLNTLVRKISNSNIGAVMAILSLWHGKCSSKEICTERASKLKVHIN